jgi:meiotic recombination protein DMC1
MQAQKQVTQNDEVEEEEECPFNDLNMLEKCGIGQADIIKLRNVGIMTVKGILQTQKKELMQIKGITEAKVDKIFESAMKIENCKFINGNEVL